MSQRINPLLFRRPQNLGDSSFQQQIYNSSYFPYLSNQHEQATNYITNFMRQLGLSLHSFRFMKTAIGKCFIVIRYISINEPNKKSTLKLNFTQLEEAFVYGIVKIVKTDSVSVSFFDLGKDYNEISLPKNLTHTRSFYETLEIKKSMGLIIAQQGSAYFLANFIASKISILRSKINKKSQAQFLTLVKSLIFYVKNNTNANFEGIKIVVKGRINGVPKTKKWVIFEGVLSLQQTENNIDYSYVPSFTVYGIFGVKVWINYGKFLKNDKTRKDQI